MRLSWCLVGYHNWGKWVRRRVSMIPGFGAAVRESRVCIECGHLQDREV